jgi:hypothetical protein
MNKADGIVTWLLMFVVLMSVVAWSSLTIGFEDKCQSACSPARFITPLYEFQHSCFCDDGGGRWRRENIK